MSSPSLPPEIPKRSLVPLVLGGLGALAASVAVLVWALAKAPAPEPRTSAVPVAAAKPAAVPAVSAVPEPPPPPPPEAALATPAPAGSSRPPFSGREPVGAAAAPSTPTPGKKSDPNCDDPCNGKETPELLSALRAKAGQARSCYERALSNDSALAGRLEIALRVSRTGTACSASVEQDGLGSAAVTSCVLQRFRGGKYPQPTGGCVNVSVPMNFMPAGSR